MSIVPIPDVSIIGAGRVARQLCHALFNNGIKINEIFSRSFEHAKSLSKEIKGSTCTDQLDFSASHSRIFIISIKDDAILLVAEKLRLPQGSILLHTSGTVSMDVLSNCSTDFGIIYPLQTFAHGTLLDFKSLPILIEGSNERTIKIIHQLAQTLSNRICETKEADRQQLHIAAVFASNFTNRMLAFAHQILDKTSLDFDILKPLVLQSIENAFDSNPDQALTGPAKRGDQETINSHLNLLNMAPELKSIYDQITKSILSKNVTKNG